MTIPALGDLNLYAALPAIFLALFTTFLLIIDLFIASEHKNNTAYLALGALGIAFIWNLLTFNNNTTAFLGMFVADSFSGFLNMVVLIGAMLTILLSMDYLRRMGIEHGEYYSMVLFSTAGMMFMGSANNLIVIFIALELLSIPLYVMAAIRHQDVKSEESGIKYFILGAFASAFFVYGAALIYGATGTTNLPAIFTAVGDIVNTGSDSIFYLVAGAALIIVALGFKVAVVPFHMWTPDVYEGAPTPVTAFMSVGAKAGGFAALLRVMVVALPSLTVNSSDAAAVWQLTIAVIAALTMILGNIVAISQTNIKRMLAYSSIAHAGYILMAVAAAGSAGVGDASTRGMLVYLLAYTFTNLGAFAVVITLEKEDGSGTAIEDFVGLGKSRPFLAAMMAFFMLSLTGVPATAGFIGKFLVFGASVEAGLIWLAVIGVLTSVFSAYYYVRIIVNMYLRDTDKPAEVVGETPFVKYATYISFTAVLVLGLFPALALNLLGGAQITLASLF
ncbi:MAG: NADH-quinone oxidoreductase subunit N [Anaerolineae bacterium]|nr:NADH-quinone oxidoreductase subunit N [Anaerolineae bacterium]